MSQAVSTTGILVRRKALATPPASVAVASSSVANPTVITTSAPHLLNTGDTTTIAGHTGSTPTVNGLRTVTVLTPTTFTIPVNVTVGGTGGTSVAEYQVIAEITNVSPGGKARNKIETSNHNEGRESHVLGILRQKDPGLNINLIGGDASHAAINGDIDNNLKNSWQFAFPSGITRTGDARVQAFDLDDAPVDGKQGAKVTLAWAGPVTEVFV